MNELNLNIESINAEGNEIIIRTGEAAPIIEPQKYSISGITIDSLTDYLLKREQLINKDEIVIELNNECRQISASLNPNDPLADTLSASMKINPQLAAFGINSSRRYSREDMVKVIKFNRVYLGDQVTAILLHLNDFNASISASIKEQSDNRGNKHASANIKVKTELSLGFKLAMPIFVGSPASEFFVDIAFDISDGSVAFWLESVDLKELEIKAVEETFSAFRKQFHKYAILEK